MNYKQKLGYILFGAGIMAIGIIIGQVITPDIEAQSNGVFDKITCRELEVVDEKGERGIVLLAVGDTNAIVIGDNSPGTGRIYLSTDHGTNGITITDGAGNSAIEVRRPRNIRIMSKLFDKAEKDGYSFEYPRRC